MPKILTETGLTELISKVKEADSKKVNTPENGTIVTVGTVKPVNDSDYQKIQGSATNNNFAIFNNGQVIDSGLDEEDFIIADDKASKKIVDATTKVTQTRIAELSSNKVTTISPSSTDIEYPSAKCVYDNDQTIREQIAGLKNTYVVSDVTNPIFNTQDNTITINSSITDINGNTITINDVKIGDTIYIKELDVPDRWVMQINSEGSPSTRVSYVVSKLETTKERVLDVQVNTTGGSPTTVINQGIAEIITNSQYNASTNKVATMSDVPVDAVIYNVQSLTTEQKAQARTNIGANKSIEILELD